MLRYALTLNITLCTGRRTLHYALTLNVTLYSLKIGSVPILLLILRFLFIQYNMKEKIAIALIEQVCIPVGCVPARLLPVSHSMHCSGGVCSWGVSGPQGVSGSGGVWSWGVWSGPRGVYPSMH